MTPLFNFFNAPIVSYLLLFTQGCLGWPASSFFTSLVSELIPPSVSQHASPVPRDFPTGLSQLRLLCVGDSITVGIGDGYPILEGLNNGYRLDLYKRLTTHGIDVQFLGTQISGTDNPQPRMEGYGFQTIDTILGKLQNDSMLDSHPNLVLIHAGTNDNDLPQTSNDPSILYADAPYRLGNLIDFVLCRDPTAVVLVAKLVQNKYNQEQTNAFNAQVPVVVGERYMKGFKVRVVDMSMIGGEELSDDLHPTSAGYTDMANRWYSAILGVPESWWSSSDSFIPTFGGPLETCDRDSISFSPAMDGNVVAAGFHVSGDTPEPHSSPETEGNTFSPGWSDDGVVAVVADLPGSGVTLADLNGDGRPDYIWVNYTAGSEGAVHAWLNGGTDTWNAVFDGGEIALGSPGTVYVEFADLDGDKKAEYILVANGKFKIWKNGGALGQIWSWHELPNAEDQLNYIFAGAIPYHYFADMTGNGRADLIIYNTDSVLDIYINQGSDSKGGFSWKQCKAVGFATGAPMFADIDGDGKADYVSMAPGGSLSGWLNKYSGGCDFTWAAINGRGPGSLALGAGAPSDAVRLVDLTGDRKADYLVVNSVTGAIHLYPNTGSVHPPESNGIGGYGAAVRLNDMNGDGRDDYISVTNHSGIAVWLNGGQGSGDTWTWNEQDNGVVIALGFPEATRNEVRLADMNADGRDDYLVVDETTGALHCYLNLGPSASSSWSWNIMGEIAIGVGGVGAGVRIADFDGDGRADYIYLDEYGSATIWLNAGSGNDLETWKAINGGAVAALGVGANRDDVQFADIDGDGKADYCWIHPDTGAVDVWYNLWDGHGAGWSSKHTVLSGQGYPGQNIRLARIGTSGRHDYVALNEDNGSFKVWTNECSHVLSSKQRPVSGACGTPPLPPQASPEPIPAPQPSEISTNVGGQTVLQGAQGGQVTLPLGITSPTTITETDGQVITYIPGGNTKATTFTNSVGQTIVQGSLGDQTTLPTGVTALVTVTESNGEVVTYDPSAILPTSSIVIIGTDAAGETTISKSGEAITLPTGITTPITSTASDGLVFTWVPPTQTVVSKSGEAITLPTGVTTPITTTVPDGVVFTWSPPTITTTSSSTTAPAGFIFPIFTSVPAPTSSKGATVIPCKMWFFFVCIKWGDLDIGGWAFDLPPGPRPPGPPPPITFPASLHITVNTIGPLPPWPKMTIGSDKIPTLTPTTQPEDCTTTSGEICLTSTSYGVSAKSTTATQVFSTCATVYGCDVEDSSRSTTSTSSCSATAGCDCYSWGYDVRIDWDAVGDGDPDDTVQFKRHRRAPISTNLARLTTGIPTGQIPTLTTPAPQIDRAVIQKRVTTDGRSSTAFGACVLNAAARFLDYPVIADLPQYPQVSSYYVLSRKSVDAGTCFAAYMYSTSDIAGLTVTKGGVPYATTGPFPTPVVNIDHVFENSLLGSFFEFALAQPDAPTCEDFNTRFVDTGFLQTMFDNLANINHPDFIAVDRFINKIKANFFKLTDGIPNVGSQQFGNAIQALQDFGIAAKYVGYPDAISLFRQTHQRLYQILGTFDQAFAGCDDPGVVDSWADKYSVWMTDHLAARSAAFTDAAAAWYQTLTAGRDRGANVPVFTQLAVTYPASVFGLPVEAMASGLVKAAPAKRQAAACPFSTSAISTASATSFPSTAATQLPSTTQAPSTTEAPTTTVTTQYPTNTAENEGGAYCFSPSDGNYVSFTSDDAQNVVKPFCAQNYVLQPGNTFGFNEGYQADGYTVFASASWAEDQTGCSPEADSAFNANSDHCLDGWDTDFYCGGESSDSSTSYGGAYVLNSPNGCILISLSASSSSSSSRKMLHRSTFADGPWGPVEFNSTTSHPDSTLLNLRKGADAPSMWAVNTFGQHHLFNQSVRDHILSA